MIGLLFVNRKCHTTDHTYEDTPLPSHLIQGAEGKIIFEESGTRVCEFRL